jgi:hypothetical protein
MRYVFALAVALTALSVGVATVGAEPTAQTAHKKKKCNKIKDQKKKKKCKRHRHGHPGTPGAPGTQGASGVGAPGTPGTPAQEKATLGSADFTTGTDGPLFRHNPSNGTVSQTPDGIEFGPYMDGSSEGGSVEYNGLNGQPLSAVQSLAYLARYTSDGDTGGVAVPYLRIFLEGDMHDAIFSPNTQPPDPDVEEGVFHNWVATSGVWRYDDDAGAGGPGTYGVNGAPFSTVVGDHGDETISGIYITTGFSAGVDLAALLQEWRINETIYSFTS